MAPAFPNLLSTSLLLIGPRRVSRRHSSCNKGEENTRRPEGSRRCPWMYPPMKIHFAPLCGLGAPASYWPMAAADVRATAADWQPDPSGQY